MFTQALDSVAQLYFLALDSRHFPGVRRPLPLQKFSARTAPKCTQMSVEANCSWVKFRSRMADERGDCRLAWLCPTQHDVQEVDDVEDDDGSSCSVVERRGTRADTADWRQRSTTPWTSPVCTPATSTKRRTACSFFTLCGVVHISLERSFQRCYSWDQTIMERGSLFVTRGTWPGSVSAE